MGLREQLNDAHVERQRKFFPPVRRVIVPSPPVQAAISIEETAQRREAERIEQLRALSERARAVTVMPDVEPARPSIKLIVRVVAVYYDTTPTDIMSHRRIKEIVRPRQVAMYLAKEHTLQVFSAIGRSFDNRDHTTVLHAFRKIKRLREEDPDLNAEIEQLTELLKV